MGNMAESTKPSLTFSLTPSVAILIGSVIIALAILVSNGTISWKGSAQDSKNPPTALAQPTTAPGQPQVSLATINDVFNKSQIKFGDTSKKVIFIEASDPSCPYCQAATGQNPELNKQMGPQFTMAADGGSYVPPVPEMEKLVKNGKAAFVYLYFPGHGNGEMGAKALYCAADNNKFWEANDLLMSADGYNLLNNTVKNDKAKSGEIADFLKSVVDPATMKSCLDSGKYDSRLSEDTSLASSLGINGTPGFYVNATLYAGAYSYKEMEPTVDALLK